MSKFKSFIGIGFTSLAIIFMLSSCSIFKKKDCDCPKWSLSEEKTDLNENGFRLLVK